MSTTSATTPDRFGVPGTNVSTNNMVVDSSSGSGMRQPVDGFRMAVSLPGIKSVIKPRDGPSATRDDWVEEVADVMSIYPDVYACFSTVPPTLAECVTRWPDIPADAQLQRFTIALNEYQVVNGAVYRMLRPSVDLSGPFMATDKRHIARSFVAGDKRDGRGLYDWCLSFSGTSGAEGELGSQLELYNKIQQLKLTQGANRTTIATHMDELLTLWLRVGANSVDQPGQFYLLLLSSFPTEPDTSKVVRLRGWFAEKITEKSPQLADVYSFFALLNAHAVTIAIPDGNSSGQGGSALALTGDGGKKGAKANNCKKCDLFWCEGLTKCWIFGNKTYLANLTDKRTKRIADDARLILVDEPTIKSFKGWSASKIEQKGKPLRPARDADASGAKDDKSSKDDKPSQSTKKQVTFIGTSGSAEMANLAANPDMVALMQRASVAEDDNLVLCIDIEVPDFELIVMMVDDGNDDAVSLADENAQLRIALEDANRRRSSSLMAPSPAAQTPASRLVNPALATPRTGGSRTSSGMLAALRSAPSRGNDDDDADDASTKVSAPAMMAKALLSYERELAKARREKYTTNRVLAIVRVIATMPVHATVYMLSKLSYAQLITVAFVVRVSWPYAAPHLRRELTRAARNVLALIKTSWGDVIKYSRTALAAMITSFVAKRIALQPMVQPGVEQAWANDGGTSSGGASDGGSGGATPVPSAPPAMPTIAESPSQAQPTPDDEPADLASLVPAASQTESVVVSVEMPVTAASQTEPVITTESSTETGELTLDVPPLETSVCVIGAWQHQSVVSLADDLRGQLDVHRPTEFSTAAFVALHASACVLVGDDCESPERLAAASMIESRLAGTLTVRPEVLCVINSVQSRCDLLTRALLPSSPEFALSGQPLDIQHDYRAFDGTLESIAHALVESISSLQWPDLCSRLMLMRCTSVRFADFIDALWLGRRPMVAACVARGSLHAPAELDQSNAYARLSHAIDVAVAAKRYPIGCVMASPDVVFTGGSSGRPAQRVCCIELVNISATSSFEQLAYPLPCVQDARASCSLAFWSPCVDDMPRLCCWRVHEEARGTMRIMYGCLGYQAAYQDCSADFNWRRRCQVSVDVVVSLVSTPSIPGFDSTGEWMRRPQFPIQPEFFDFVFSTELSLANATLAFEMWCSDIAAGMPVGAERRVVVCTRELYRQHEWDGHKTEYNTVEVQMARCVAISACTLPTQLWVDSCKARSYPYVSCQLHKPFDANGQILTGIYKLPSVGSKRSREFVMAVVDPLQCVAIVDEREETAAAILQRAWRVRDGYDGSNLHCPDRQPGCRCAQSWFAFACERQCATTIQAMARGWLVRKLAARATLVGSQYSRHFVVPVVADTVMITTPFAHSALADNGASVNCSKNALGLIPGTHVGSDFNLEVGDDKSSLAAHGQNVHALRLTGYNGQVHEELFLMHDTPSVIVTVLSEPRMVYKHNACIEFSAQHGRIWKLPGCDLQLTMNSNGLGWFKLEAITDAESIRALLARNKVFVNASPRKQVALPIAAADDYVFVLGNTAHRVMGRLVDYSGVELLKRFHLLSGHRPIDDCLQSMKEVAPAMYRRITRDDIKQVLRDACGFCESCKMPRPSFPSSGSDRPLPGKRWTYDTMHLKVPSFMHGFLYITCFVDRGSGPKGFRRSYGHKKQDEVTHELLVAKLRAFARPITGEIEDIAHDAHPSLTGQYMRDYYADSQMNDDCAPPYVHEWSADAEVTWLHAVPPANAMLRQAGDAPKDWRHFYTSFVTYEDAENHRVDRPDGSSAATRFGLKPRDWHLHYVYGAPLKYLVHPEVRDSKFEDHALPGQYRGISRDNESDKCCWVQAEGRYITVDIGCIRIDETPVLSRMDRNHKSHLLESAVGLAKQQPDPTPRFDSWRLPGASTSQTLSTYAGPKYDAAYDFSASFTRGIVPAVEIHLLVCGGITRDFDVGCHMRQMQSEVRTIHPVVIDPKIGGYAHDLLRHSVEMDAYKFADAPVTTTVGCSVPCETWTVLKHGDDGGPSPDRDIDHVYGFPDADGNPSAKCVQHDKLLMVALRCLELAHARGAAGWFEHPPAYNKDSPFYIPGKEKHVSIFQHPLVVEFEARTGAQEFPIDQCSAVRLGPGSDSRKPTILMVLPSMCEWAREFISTVRCHHDGSHAKPAKGTMADGSFASADSDIFPPGMCGLLAEFAYAAPAMPKNAAAMSKRPEVKQFDDPDDPYPVGTELDVFWAKPKALRGFYKGHVTKSYVVTFKTVAPKREMHVKYLTDGEEYRHRVYDAVVRCPSENVDDFEPWPMDKSPNMTVNLIASVGAIEPSALQPDSTRDELVAMAVEQREADLALAVAQNMHTRDNAPHDAVMCHSRVLSGYPILLSVDDWRLEDSHRPLVFAVGNAAYTLWLSDVKNWTAPKNERELGLCPQKSIWRSAQELKLEDYEAEHRYEFVVAQEAIDAGQPVWRTLWARVFKSLGDRARAAPRLCVQGTGMKSDDSIKTFHDVPRFQTVRVLFIVRTLPYTVDVALDNSDAFQSTFIDGSDPEVTEQRVLYFEQAPGHARPGPSGQFSGPQRYVCKSNVAWQGAPFSGRVFGKRFAVILLKAGFRRCTWDRQAYVLHQGAEANKADHLVDVLERCRHLPVDEQGPCGWMFCAVHVDDVIGVCSSIRVADYLKAQISKVYVCDYTPWRKVLGFHVDIRLLSDGSSIVRVSAEDVLEQVQAKFLDGDVARIKPKHVMSPAIDQLGPGQPPSPDTPEYADFLKMQSDARALMGTGIWLQGSYERLKYAVNMNCEFMDNPSWEGYKSLKIAFLHVIANPVPWTAGGHGHAFEIKPAQELTPLQNDQPKSAVLHTFVDASMRARAVTGYVAMIMGVCVDSYCGRQQMRSAESHSVEAIAASTAVHRLIPLRGLLHEIGLLQPQATPLFVDSQSTVYVANDDVAAKKSIWILRRIGVVLDSVQMGDVAVIKINRSFNVADIFTRYNTYDTWIRFMHYIENYFATLPDPVDAT